MKKEIYIALDLETSGVDPEKDKIIEIGIAKFENDQIIDTFETLINPQRKISPTVLAITGINEKDLQSAPLFEEVKDKIIDFIGNYPLVGHNIQFDLRFLKEAGVEIKNPFFDTWHLATIVLPYLSSYSLSYLTSKFNLEHLETHRALSDAIASYSLFLYLKNEIKKLPPAVLKKIYSTLEKFDFKYKNLFLPQGFSEDFVLRSSQKIKTTPKKEFQEYIKKFEIDESEVELAKEIIKSLIKNKKLFVEGYIDFKTLFFYLLLWIRKERTKIILAVPDLQETKNQIRQLNDIFFLPSNFAFLESYYSYICPLRFGNFGEKIKKDPKNEALLRFWTKVQLLIKAIEGGFSEDLALGTKSDLALIKEEANFFKQINTPFPGCFKNCPLENCFYKKSIEIAQKSKILIVPQSILSEDYYNFIFDQFENIIIFDAEELEESIERGKTYFLTPEKFDLILDISKKFKIKNLSEIEKIVEIFWGLLGIFIKKEGEKKERNKNFVIFKKQHILSPDFKNFQKASLHLANLLEKLKSDLKTILEKNKKYAQQIDLIFAIKEIDQIVEFLKDGIIDFSNNLGIFWGEIINKGDSLRLGSKPIFIKPHILKTYKSKKSIVLVSSSLSIQKKLDFIKKTTGIFDFEEKIVDLGKKIPEHKITFVVLENFPEINAVNYLDQLNLLVEQISLNFKKPIFVFQNRQTQSNIFENIAYFFRKANLDLFNQEGKRLLGKHLEEFASISRGVLFVAPSNVSKFLKRKPKAEIIIFEKFPFTSQGPLEEFKEEFFYDQFLEQNLSKAVLRFKKIIELFRAQNKNGIVVVLNRSFLDKNYGISFIQSLQNISFYQVKRENLIDFLKERKDIKKD